MDFSIIAERRIQEAIDEGVFDNLPTKGKPLHLDDTPLHIRLLRNANVLPDWAQLDIDIRKARELCAVQRGRTVEDYARRVASAGRFGGADMAEWLKRRRAAFEAELKRINGEIVRLNMLAPPVLREIHPYRIAQEMAAFDAEMEAVARSGGKERGKAS